MRLFAPREPVDEVGSVDERRLRAARVAAARRTRWQELEEGEFVSRGAPGWLVHEPTDAIYVVKRGGVWAPAGATIEFASPDDPALAFFVTGRDEVVVLERLSSPRSWSEHFSRQELRRLRAAR